MYKYATLHHYYKYTTLHSPHHTAPHHTTPHYTALHYTTLLMHCTALHYTTHMNMYVCTFRALGATLYMMVTGSPPWTARNEVELAHKVGR